MHVSFEHNVGSEEGDVVILIGPNLDWAKLELVSEAFIEHLSDFVSEYFLFGGHYASWKIGNPGPRNRPVGVIACCAGPTCLLERA